MADTVRLRNVTNWIEAQQKSGTPFVFNMNTFLAHIGEDGENLDVLGVAEQFKNGEPWACGTNACLAGAAALSTGESIISHAGGEFILDEDEEGNLELVDVAEWAGKYFDLHPSDAQRIFWYTESETGEPASLDDVKRRINYVLGELVFPEVE